MVRSIPSVQRQSSTGNIKQGSTPSPTALFTTSPGSKPYCSECDTYFATPQSLRRHMQNHTGDYDYRCSLLFIMPLGCSNNAIFRIRVINWTGPVCPHTYSCQLVFRWHGHLVG